MLIYSVKDHHVFILPPWFSKLIYNYHGPFLVVSEIWEPIAKKTVGIFGALEFVGIMGASVSDRWE